MNQPRTLVAALALLAACSHLRAPDQGGPPWHRAATARFSIESHAKPRSHPMTFALTPYAGALRVETLSAPEVRALFDLLWQRTGDLR